MLPKRPCVRSIRKWASSPDNKMRVAKQLAFSHNEIKGDRQQGVAAVFLAVACHQQQQKYNRQVTHIKALGQQVT